MGIWRLGRKWVMKYQRKGEVISWLEFRTGPSLHFTLHIHTLLLALLLS